MVKKIVSSHQVNSVEQHWRIETCWSQDCWIISQEYVFHYDVILLLVDNIPDGQPDFFLTVM